MRPGLSLNGGEVPQVCSMEQQSGLLPDCDLMIITGTTLINGTIDQLLSWCSRMRNRYGRVVHANDR